MTRMPPRTALNQLIDTPPPIPDSDTALAEELTRLAGHINAAQHRFLKLLAALIDREAWGGDSGMKSPAHWLNYYCGIDLGAAREKVRVARALDTLPLIDSAFASGAISYSKVRAMTRSATPQNEATLLNVARHGTAQHVEKLVRQHRRVLRLNAEETNSHQFRDLSYYYDDDGMLVIRGRFAPEEGAVLLKALEAAMDQAERERGEQEDQGSKNVSAETPVQGPAPKTFPQKRADALSRLAEHYLAGDPEGTQPLSNGDKYQVCVHLDARRNSPLGSIGMTRMLEDGPPLPEATFRRLACDASLLTVIREEDGNVLNIGRRSRAVPPTIRRALKIRDGGCRYPGCGQIRYVDAHHIQHWCDGGETSLDNLVLLCRHHHRLLHEGGFVIGKDGDRLRFLDRQQNEIAPARYPQFQAARISGDGRTEIETGNAKRGISIEPGTAVTLWQGEPMDYGMAVESLL